jgi:hypothetical protein
LLAFNLVFVSSFLFAFNPIVRFSGVFFIADDKKPSNFAKLLIPP